MKDNDYLIIVFVIGIVLIISLVYLAQTTDVFIPQEERATGELIIPTFRDIPEQTIDCMLCHIQPETLAKHVNGGEYCTKCHESDIHGIHLKDSTNATICNACHGNSQTVPEPLPGHIVICDTCHDYPDPSQPSYGNIITIHKTRGYTCTICHIQDLQSLHKVDSLNRTLI